MNVSLLSDNRMQTKFRNYKSSVKIAAFLCIVDDEFLFTKNIIFFGRNAHTPNSFYVMKHFTVLSQCSGNERARTCTLN